MIDLVAGYAKGYNGYQMRPFLKSLRESGYTGKILLFTDRATQEAKRWDAEVLAIPHPPIKVHSARFICLQEEIQKRSHGGVFLSDTRDVIFQGNPVNLPSDGFHAFEEDASMTLGTCPYNSEWIQLGYGRQILQALAPHPISCVGTSCGDMPSIRYYLSKLRGEVERIQPKTNKPQDQAAHNYLIRREIGSQIGLTIWPNENDFVYTVGYIPRGTVRIVDDQIINKAGEVPIVIHQWDRHKNLSALVGRKYEFHK